MTNTQKALALIHTLLTAAPNWQKACLHQIISSIICHTAQDARH